MAFYTRKFFCPFSKVFRQSQRIRGPSRKVAKGRGRHLVGRLAAALFCRRAHRADHGAIVFDPVTLEDG